MLREGTETNTVSWACPPPLPFEHEGPKPLPSHHSQRLGSCEDEPVAALNELPALTGAGRDLRAAVSVDNISRAGRVTDPQDLWWYLAVWWKLGEGIGWQLRGEGRVRSQTCSCTHLRHGASRCFSWSCCCCCCPGACMGFWDIPKPAWALARDPRDGIS